MSRQVYDPIRQKWVEATPEEVVRQKLIRHLVDSLGYPPSTIMIEKKLSEFPLLQMKGVPHRRLDILCLEGESLRPLLLIECKGIPLTEKMLAQVMGYNAFIGAPLICLADEEGFLLGWRDPKQAICQDRIPTYEELKKIS